MWELYDTVEALGAVFAVDALSRFRWLEACEVLEGPDSLRIALTSFGDMRAAHVCGIEGYDRFAVAGLWT